MGVGRDATSEEIKKAYRQLARKYHPDVNKEQGAEARFKEINEAHEVLSDPEKRKRYDSFGHAAFDPAAGGPGGGGFDFGGFGRGADPFGDLGDIFDAFFGGGRGRERPSGPRRGADLRYDLEVGFVDAAFGCQVDIEIPRMEACDRCKGSGAEPGTVLQSCPVCKGTGQVQQVQSSPFGRFVSVQTCARCRGEGSFTDKPCRECRGRGQVEQARRITVKVPAGVDTGQRLRLSREGEAGEKGGPPGDLYVYVTVRPHDLFKRDGANIVCEIPIGFVQAALGDEIQVPSLDGPAKLSVTEGTQTGTVFRLKGKGIPNLRGFGRGDQLVRVVVVTPTRLTKEQRELLRQFDRSSQAKARA